MTDPEPILLSPPEVDASDEEAVLAAMRSGWIAPLGPEVEGFEADFRHLTGADHALATASGTAGLHLALLGAGVGPGDEVIVSDLSFVSAPNAVVYTGARPVLVDAEPGSWQIDPFLVEEAIGSGLARGTRPAAVLVVHLYGQMADMDALGEICRRHGIPLIEDAAEALGATHRGRAAGSIGDAGVFSFNGNKIITTSGGGMLVTSDARVEARARHLATQARLPVAHYEHDQIGFNYRLSNLLAALGRSQLRRLDQRLAARRAVRAGYQERLAGLEGVSFMPDSGTGRPSWWLTTILVDERGFGASRDDVIAHLASRAIEARPAWKPMHLQPPYRDAPCFGGSVGERIFDRGVCLPSGSGLTEAHLDRVCSALGSTPRRRLLGAA